MQDAQASQSWVISIRQLSGLEIREVRRPPTREGGGRAGASSRFQTFTARPGPVGLNRILDQSFSLPFDCVGDIEAPIFVKFAVREGGY